MLEKIHIFHTNDVHSHFEYWQRTQAFIQEQRQLLAKKGEASFLIDLGDHVDRSNIFTEATLGQGNIELLNEAQYDVVTIGNNEGITLGFEELYHLYDQAQFEVVVANLSAVDRQNPAWLKPYTILVTANGTKIGVIAATAAFEVFYKTLNWQVSDPQEALVRYAYELREQVDILVCMSHLGLSEDELLAEQCPLIDVIFGAHTHHVLPEGKWINGVLLTGGGKFGQYTGHLVISYDCEQQKIVQLVDELIENTQLASTKGEAAFLYQLAKVGEERLSEPAVQLTKTYTREWFHYSPLSDLFAQAMFEYTNADCVMFNAGIFIDHLHKGTVSTFHLHQIMPHPINVCVIELTGEELMQVYREAQNEEWPQLQLKGLGFRGVVLGKLLFYKVKLVGQALYIDGQLVESHKSYTLATLDLFTFGYFFPIFQHAKKEYYLPTFIRDIFLDYLKRQL